MWPSFTQLLGKYFICLDACLVDRNMGRISVTLSTEKLFKVLVIGDLGVGKSSIVMRYVNKRFDETYKASIGVDFALKTIEWDPKTVVRLQLWDIGGEFQNYKANSCTKILDEQAKSNFMASVINSVETVLLWKHDLKSFSKAFICKRFKCSKVISRYIYLYIMCIWIEYTRDTLTSHCIRYTCST